MKIEMVDAARERAGFLSRADTAALNARGVIVLDPGSTLVSPAATLCDGVILWPCVIVEASVIGSVCIGSGTTLYPGTRIVAKHGKILIGADAEIGEEGGFTIRADASDSSIDIGDGARLLGGGSLSMSNVIGKGAQVLGPIRMQNCVLGGGGTYGEADPDMRGAVLKGSGVARNVELPMGKVIQAFGLFTEAPVRNQSYFHPRHEVGKNT